MSDEPIAQHPIILHGQSVSIINLFVVYYVIEPLSYSDNPQRSDVCMCMSKRIFAILVHLLRYAESPVFSLLQKTYN